MARVLVFVLLLGGIVAGFAPVASAQTDTASLTIHSRFCPAQYDGSDIFVDCHGNPGVLAIEYSLYGSRALVQEMPGLDGNLTFSDLEAGSYRVESSLPVENQHPAIYCSPGDGSAPVYYKAEETATGYSFTIELTEGVAMVCDWYTLPDTDLSATTANLIVHNRFCPIDYDGSDEFADCHDTVGIAYIEYRLTGANDGSALLQSGNATFNWLKPGKTNLQIPNGQLDLPASVSCSVLGAGEEPFLVQSLSPTESLPLTLSAGETVVCDWYIYPTAAFYQQTAEVPVSVIMCPDDPGPFPPGELPDGCSGVEGARVTVYPTAAGSDFGESCITDAMGGCKPQAKYQVPVTAEVDKSTLPPGYAPLKNPTETVLYTEFAAVRFIVIPAAVDKGD
jgi:hypothetical protein